jgi:diacylglycerol O-acyltransferase / wax synthase
MRLTQADASFLYTESASGPMHISSVYVLEGELPFEKVFQHFVSRLHLVPSYRRKLAQVPMNIAHPEWVDDPDFDLANHVLEHRLPEGSTLQQGVDAAIELNEPILDRSRPLWKVYVIQGVPDRTLILQLTHHAMIDGASGIALTTVLYDFDPKGANVEPPPSQPWVPEPLPTSAELFSRAMRDNLERLAKSDPVRAFRTATNQQALLRRAFDVMSRFAARPAVMAPFNSGLVGPKRRLRWMKKSLGEIREIRRGLGGTINDVVLTVVSEAVARYLVALGERVDGQHMRIMCPVNVRTEAQEGALGNQVSAIFPMLPAWPMNPATRLGAVCAEVERIKEEQEAQALTMLQNTVPEPWPIALAPTQLVGTPRDPTAFAARFPLPLLPALGGWRPPNFGLNFVCTNVPGVQVPQYLCGHRVLDTIGVLVLSGNIGLGVTILSYNQALYFSFICEPRLLPDLEVLTNAAEAAYGELLNAARARTEQARAS